MDEMRNKLLNFLESLIKQLVLSPSYNGNIQLFYERNTNLQMFINNNNQIISNPELQKALLSYLNNKDYIGILNKLNSQINTKPANNEIDTNEVMTTSRDIEFLELSEINRSIISGEEQQIYDKAIHIAMGYNGHHNLKIGFTNGHIVPIVQDETGKEYNLNDIEEPSDTKAPTKGFSDSLILAFIIGSIIGIIFLNIYSRFMK